MRLRTAPVTVKSKSDRVASRGDRPKADVGVALSQEPHFCKPKVGSSILSSGTNRIN
jgi:hypothetical protein